MERLCRGCDSPATISGSYKRDPGRWWRPGSHGVDIPPFEKLRDFRIWEDEKPPAGTLYNYPPRGDVTALLAGYPAPTSLGAQMFAQGTICKMVAQCTQQDKSIDQAIEFAQSELKGFMRT